MAWQCTGQSCSAKWRGPARLQRRRRSDRRSGTRLALPARAPVMAATMAATHLRPTCTSTRATCCTQATGAARRTMPTPHRRWRNRCAAPRAVSSGRPRSSAALARRCRSGTNVRPVPTLRIACGQCDTRACLRRSQRPSASDAVLHWSATDTRVVRRTEPTRSRRPPTMWCCRVPDAVHRRRLHSARSTSMSTRRAATPPLPSREAKRCDSQEPRQSEAGWLTATVVVARQPRGPDDCQAAAMRSRPRRLPQSQPAGARDRVRHAPQPRLHELHLPAHCAATQR